MKFNNSGAELFIPDGLPADQALERTTHLAIAAHQDDIEIMAYHGIKECFSRNDRWFCGVVVTNGAGSPRDDLYAAYNDAQMQQVRKSEQKKAAVIGEYGAVALLDYTSAAVKEPHNAVLIRELKALIATARPKVVYTHNLADKHDTHVGVAVKVIQAVRELPVEVRPEKMVGCEVWRNLDWMTDQEKVAFDVSAHPNLAAALLEVFDSQICGGKRYDLATAGRRLANATYATAHQTDAAAALIYAMDLTPLITDVSLDIAAYVQGYIDRFGQDVRERLRKLI